MASSSDSWVKEFNEASKLADDKNARLGERSSLPPTGHETQRHLSAIRRKITILGTRLDTLENLLPKLPSCMHTPCCAAHCWLTKIPLLTCLRSPSCDLISTDRYKFCWFRSKCSVKVTIIFLHTSTVNVTRDLANIWCFDMEGTIFTPCLEVLPNVKYADGDIQTKPFLDACQLVLPVIDKFGAAMALVKSDIGGNISRLGLGGKACQLGTLSVLSAWD